MASTTAAAPMNLVNTIPGLRQIFALVAIAGAVAGGIAIFLWARGDSYSVLYANLSDRDAASVTQALSTTGIPFRVDPASGAVTVPAARLREARMQLAGQGLPGNSEGMDMLREDPGLGVSSFVEGARYQHALETELARTVASLRPVQNARVHLAIPKETAFASDSAQASASVLVELYPGRELERGQVASIVHLVASSIPNLVPERVTVIDQQGRLLSDTGDDSPAAVASAQFDKAHNVEANYARRIEQLLTPLLGPGRVSVQVHADLDFTESEQVEESYKPDPAAVRSEQTAESTQRGGNASGARGVPGAASNQPVKAGGNAAPAVAAASGAAADDATSQNKSSARSYELGKTIRHVRDPSGRIQRLTVAVLVDHVPRKNDKGETVPTALAQEELTRIEGLVKEAIGFSKDRGDSVDVMNAPFQPVPAAGPDAPVPLWQQPMAQSIARNAGGALVLMTLIFAVLRPTLRSLTRIPPPVVMPAAESIGELREDRASMSGGAAPYEQKLLTARQVVAQDPKRVAQVMKNWVGNDAG